jgi:hypothetical protein
VNIGEPPPNHLHRADRGTDQRPGRTVAARDQPRALGLPNAQRTGAGSLTPMQTWGPVPDGIEPIVGFRAWLYNLSRPRPHLYPLCSRGDEVASSPWDGAESGWVVASCGADLADPGHVPGWQCTCGFYATKSQSTLEGLFFLVIAFAERDADCGWILGRVGLAGKIIEHDDGFRAQKARIDELIPIEGDEPNSMRLAALLDVPLGDPSCGQTTASPAQVVPAERFIDPTTPSWGVGSGRSRLVPAQQRWVPWFALFRVVLLTSRSPRNSLSNLLSGDPYPTSLDYWFQHEPGRIRGTHAGTAAR